MTNAEHPSPPSEGLRLLRRSSQDRMLAGVAAGLAEYLDFDPALVRLAFVALVILGGAGIPIYLAAWLLVPEEGADTSLAGQRLAGHRWAGTGCGRAGGMPGPGGPADWARTPGPAEGARQ